MSRFSQTLNERDTQLRNLLDNANKATGVLAKRTDQVVSLIGDTNALLAQLKTQSDAVDEIWANISAAAAQLTAFIAENRAAIAAGARQAQRRPDHRRQPQGTAAGVDQAAQQVCDVAGGVGVLRPVLQGLLANLLPGQFVQPFVDAAFSDLGLDPNVLLPSDRTDPQTGQPGTPALPVPFPRTGQGGEPR